MECIYFEGGFAEFFFSERDKHCLKKHCDDQIYYFKNVNVFQALKAFVILLFVLLLARLTFLFWSRPHSL